MDLDVVMGAAAVAFGLIAASWFHGRYEARRQARALEAHNRVHEHWGIPMELRKPRHYDSDRNRKRKLKRSA